MSRVYRDGQDRRVLAGRDGEGWYAMCVGYSRLLSTDFLSFNSTWNVRVPRESERTNEELTYCAAAATPSSLI